MSLARSLLARSLARPHLRGRRDTNRSLSRVRPSRNDMGRYLPAVPVVAVDPPLTTRETALLSLLFCGLWFAANWAMNAALGFTSVSSTTILSSMSGFFTLAAGACAGVESFSVGKLVSVALRCVLFLVFVRLPAQDEVTYSRKTSRAQHHRRHDRLAQRLKAPRPPRRGRPVVALRLYRG